MILAGGLLTELLRVEVADTLAYWTVLSGPTLDVVEDVDDFLRHLRFGRAREESTTKTYAGHLRRFHAWCEENTLTRSTAAVELPHYVMQLRTTPRRTSGRNQGKTPQDSTLAPALAAVHGLYLHLADIGQVDETVVDALFVTVPQPRGDGRLVLKPRLRVDARPSHGSGRPLAATADEFAALLEAATTARDRCMVALLGACALRVGQLVSLRREDVHLVPPGTVMPGCPYVLGPHLHLMKRDGHPRGAANKNRSTVIVPVPDPVTMLYADWMRERATIPHAQSSIWAFVSFPGPTGEPGGQALGARRVQGLLAGLAQDAQIRHVHPHMVRHLVGETAADLDIARDVLQRLLGHDDPHSQDVYRNAPAAKVAQAAQAVNDKLYGAT
ncbi:tyrosine-type recombinase/integrase [Streptomyces hundungensis]|uniref:tyrosine-type recombinase/integrase n=1 Tax=Streptomyces hundungensis TaxID=1077946 RepID=UPI0013C40422|nr:tyrosine-type recombinase/integrase [Streptomyces hundungensis]